MLTVTFVRDSRKRLSSVFARGHANRGVHGEDVVCAAVSGILQAAWVGLSDVAGVEVSGRAESGDLEMRWPEDTRDRVDVHAIVATAIAQIARQEPGAVRCITREEP